MTIFCRLFLILLIGLLAPFLAITQATASAQILLPRTGINADELGS